ncbi:MAG: chemotaxis protein CheW [Proteobacteria bacterium]|nr:chemotaxis protein CheW [Pseudomonadota bacterium]
MSESVGTIDPPTKRVANRTGKYLIFTLGKEEYGIGILQVKEIIGMLPITSVPRTCPFVKGVINLRGKVIPVVDLRLKFSMAPIPYSDRTCIIVVEPPSESGSQLTGIIVDAVSEVVAVQEEETEAAPSFGASLDTNYILGIAKVGEGLKILLDMERGLLADMGAVPKDFS